MNISAIILSAAVAAQPTVQAVAVQTVTVEVPTARQSAANLRIPGCDAPHLNPATMVHLRMTRVGDDQDTVEQMFASRSAGNSGKVLGYTRIGVRYRPCAADQRDYTKEKRDVIKRFFLGKHADKTLTVEVHATPLNVRQNKTLAAINRDSNSEGETWDTGVENDEIILPYFAVDRGTLIAIDAKLVSSREYDSTIAGGALELIQKASDAISPTTALITTQNKDRFNKAANFVDSTVDGLLKVKIDEKVRLRVPIAAPETGQVLAVITLWLPPANDAYRSAKAPEQPVGQWIIYADPLRRSMVDDVEVDGPVSRASTTAATVLNYLVDDDMTLREALAGIPSVVAARDALVGADDEGAVDTGRSLCRVVSLEASSLALAPIDAGAAAWAYLTDLALPKDKMANAETGCREVEYYPPPSA